MAKSPPPEIFPSEGITEQPPPPPLYPRALEVQAPNPTDLHLGKHLVVGVHEEAVEVQECIGEQREPRVPQIHLHRLMAHRARPAARHMQTGRGLLRVTVTWRGLVQEQLTHGGICGRAHLRSEGAGDPGSVTDDCWQGQQGEREIWGDRQECDVWMGMQRAWGWAWGWTQEQE